MIRDAELSLIRFSQQATATMPPISGLPTSEPPTSEEPLAFKFHWMDEKGQGVGFRRKKGRFDGATLTLDETEVPAGAISNVSVRDERMILTVPTEEGTVGLAILLPAKQTAADLKAALDVARSAAWAAHHRDELARRGRETAYRDAVCPACAATVVLSDMPKTPQLFCTFCGTLSDRDDQQIAPIAELQTYRLCDECGYFSQPKKFTVFYFYFLLVVYGWHSRTTYRCPACMRGDAWKMLFGNAPFLLGVPVAVTQLARSYSADIGNGPFAGLDAGNRAARAGKFPKAIEKYRAILDAHGHAAGIKYNLGLALLGQDDKLRAAQTFRLALEDCANYAPAYLQLRPLYEELGETERLAELKRQWDDEPADVAPATDA